MAEDDRIALPVFCHPLSWKLRFRQRRYSHSVLFGQIVRLAGADATIYPNFGGRFSFSLEECRSIAAAHACHGGLKPIFPCPAGGMSLRVFPAPSRFMKRGCFAHWRGAFQVRTGPRENSRYFRSVAETGVFVLIGYNLTYRRE